MRCVVYLVLLSSAILVDSRVISQKSIDDYQKIGWYDNAKSELIPDDERKNDVYSHLRNQEEEDYDSMEEYDDTSDEEDDQGVEEPEDVEEEENDGSSDGSDDPEDTPEDSEDSEDPDQGYDEEDYHENSNDNIYEGSEETDEQIPEEFQDQFWKVLSSKTMKIQGGRAARIEIVKKFEISIHYDNDHKMNRF